MNYKKIFRSFILLALFSGFLFCGQKEDDITLAKKLHFPKDEARTVSSYISWLNSFGNEFKNHEIDEPKVKESIDSFFSNEKYIVVSENNYNNMKIYVAIKECLD